MYQVKYRKMSIKWKCKYIQDHVISKEDLKHGCVRLCCDTEKFPVLHFTNLHKNPHVVLDLSKNFIFC